jgi:hypothetical protein
MSEQHDEVVDGAAIMHPEEIRLEGEIRIGQNAVVRGRTRFTPAGLVCCGLMVAMILLSTAALVRAARMPRPRQSP